MPTKFVTRAAERAGVSLETAEHRWADAKKAVHKGKRRGSWYWGKVMNTFKRMMGLMEAVTLKEWMLHEEDHPFASWPESIHLYGPYVATRHMEMPHYVRYEIEEIMGKQIDAQIDAAVIPDRRVRDGDATYTFCIAGDCGQGLGITSTFNVSDFKKWAIDALKSKEGQLGLKDEHEA